MGAPSNICNGLWFADKQSHDFIAWANRKVFAMIYEQHKFSEIYGRPDLVWYITRSLRCDVCFFFHYIGSYFIPETGGKCNPLIICVPN